MKTSKNNPKKRIRGEEHKIYNRNYYELNKEEIKIKRKSYFKDYYQKNKDRERLKYEENKKIISEKNKSRYKLNKETLSIKHKEYYEKNKKHLCEKRKIYVKKNKETIKQNKKEYHNKKTKENYLYKLKGNIRCLIRNSLFLKGFKKNSKTVQILGCQFKEFKIYIESKFESWMNWDNYGKYNGELNYGWDLDHIIPLSSAKNEHDIVSLNHYKNFQPLCSKVNRDIKTNKY